MCEIRAIKLIITFYQICLSISEAHLSSLVPRNKEGWKEEKARVRSEATMNLAANFGLSLGLACSLGLPFLSFSLLTQAWSLSHLCSIWRVHVCTSYICENKWSHVCILVSHWVFLLWKNPKESVIASPQLSLPLLCQRGTFVSLACSLIRVENPGVFPSLMNTFTVHEG